MRLLIYCYRYGITHPQLLSLFTRENWWTVEVPLELLMQIQASTTPIRNDLYRGDQVFVGLENLDDIRNCAAYYGCTNYDELCANLIRKSFIEGIEEVTKHILSTRKIALALSDANFSGIPIDEFIVCIGGKEDVIPRALRYAYTVKFEAIDQLLANRGATYNRESYMAAGKTDVVLIQEIHSRFTIKSDHILVLYRESLEAQNVPLVRFLMTLIDVVVGAKMLRTFLNFIGVQEEICISAMLTGQSDIIGFALQLTEAKYETYIQYCGSVDLLKTVAVRRENTSVGLRTAAWLANLELIDFWLTGSTFETNIAELAEGAAAAGHGAIFDVTIQILQHLDHLSSEMFKQLFAIAYSFDNYHCIAILTKYDKTEILRRSNGYPVRNNGYYGNQMIPNKQNRPAHWDEWFNSLYPTSTKQ
jgi:hypothetical protein